MDKHMDKHIRKQIFIDQLARFFTENAGGKSIAIQLERQRPSNDPIPHTATEWGQLRTAACIRGYPTLDEAKDTLNELLS